MADEAALAESSPATEIATPSLESLDSTQYQAWRKTGEFPEAKPADTPPAKEVEKTPPANSPATPAEPKEPDEADVEGLNPKTKARIQSFLKERSELKARIAELEKNGKPPEPEKVAKPAESTPAAKDGPQPPVKPKQDDFKTWEEYQDAKDKYLEELVDFKAEQKAAKLVAESESKRSERDKGNEVAASWNKRVEATKAKHADFDEVAKNIPFNETAARFLLDSDIGPEILYHLGSNLEDAERIKGLSEMQTARELTRIEDSLKKPATPGPKKVPAAHTPPTEVSTNASPADEVEGAGAAGDFASYKRLQNAKELAARKR